MGIYGSIASGLFSAVQTLHQTESEIQSADYQEKQASINYHLINQAAGAAAADIRSQTGQMVGTQAARTKAGGVTLSGSPLQVMADTAAEGELKAQRALFAGKVLATRESDVAEMAKFNQYFLKWNRFNRAGAAFVSSFASSGGGGQIGNLSSSGSSLLGGG